MALDTMEQKGQSLHGDGKEERCLRLFNSRNEEEIIIDPKRLKDIKPHETTAKTANEKIVSY